MRYPGRIRRTNFTQLTLLITACVRHMNQENKSQEAKKSLVQILAGKILAQFEKLRLMIYLSVRRIVFKLLKLRIQCLL